MAANLARAEEQNAVVLPGRDHCALALVPISTTERGDRRVEVTYHAEVDGKPRRISVTLDAASGAGLPVHGDEVVYLALLQLAHQRAPTGAPLTFRRPELLRVLAWGDDSGQTYSRLADALRRLQGLQIIVNSALIARNGHEYSRRERGSHPIDDYDIGSGHNAECRVVWGELVREAFALDDFKRLDWPLLRRLRNPVAGQLYRLLDRVALAGGDTWSIGWRPLALALGLNAAGYKRPARLRQVLAPHLSALVDEEVIDGYDYGRGGDFTFHLHNLLRRRLRELLSDEYGVYADTACQLLAGFDEAVIMAQCDCLVHGQRGQPKDRAAYLVEAIRRGFALRYPDHEPLHFAALWGTLGPEERRAYHQAGLRLLGTADSLFDTSSDPTAWSPELRAVVRFMIAHGIDPEQVVKPPAGLLPVGPPE